MSELVSELVDQLITVPYKDKFIEFKTRTKPGFDDTVSDKIIIREIFGENVYQVNEESFNDTGVVIDIGANIGAFSIQAVLLGAGRVYAFEPEEDNYRILVDNINLNGFQDKITPIKMGIFNDNAKHEFLTGQGASHIINVKNVPGRMLEKAGNAEIDTITFKDMWGMLEAEKCDVLKMDIEGSEYHIFKDQPVELLERIRYLTMEFHTTNQQQFGDMIATLTKAFKVHTLGSYERGGQTYCERY